MGSYEVTGLRPPMVLIVFFLCQGFIGVGRKARAWSLSGFDGGRLDQFFLINSAHQYNVYCSYK